MIFSFSPLEVSCLPSCQVNPKSQAMGFRDCLPCFGGAKEGNTADGASEEAQTPNHPTTAPAKPSVSPPSSRIENEAQPTAHPSDGYPFTAHGVWRSAYEELRGDDSTHALVIAYEDLLRSKLSQMLPPEDTLDASDLVSKFAGFDSTLRSDFMDKVANQHIEKLEASVGKACLPKVLEFVDKIKATVGQALSSCPAASIAWTVTCLLIVPVSFQCSMPAYTTRKLINVARSLNTTARTRRIKAVSRTLYPAYRGIMSRSSSSSLTTGAMQTNSEK